MNLNNEETDRYFYHSDHLGSSSYITDWKGNVSQFMVYLPFGELLVDKHVTGKSEMPYKFNAKEKDEETGLYYYGARYYNGKDQVWMGVDPLWEKYPGVSPYAYCANNPVKYIDPDGEAINLAAAAVGAIVGGVVGGGVEVISQLYKNGSVTNWSAVGGSAAQGAITGGVAGLTMGASIVATVAVSSTANVVGGVVNRGIQGQQTTISDVVTDAAVGGTAGLLGGVAGKFVEKGVNNLSNAAKGKLGEVATQAKYSVKGYVSKGKAPVSTGAKTATGKNQQALYDHDMQNVLTGNKLTVESKFGSSNLTGNQRAAQSNVQTSGGLIIDRTTSTQVDNAAKATLSGSSGSVSNQINK